MKQNRVYLTFVHILFALMTIAFLVPFLIIVVISISNEADITSYGFRLLPSQIDFTAYGIMFKNSAVIVRSMLWTAFVSLVTPALTVLLNAMFAYPLSRSDSAFKKPFNYFLIVTMMFSGGLIPTYIINTQIFNLGNNPLVYFIGTTGLTAGMVSAWTIILFRTFFKSIPDSLIESAVIDGASQPRVLWHIILPMSKSIVAIVYFQGVIGRWNDYQMSLIYMNTNETFQTIQHFLQRILQSASEAAAAALMTGTSYTSDIPTMTLQYAMCVLSILPVFLLFPFVQKYFSKGLAVGSVKE